MNIEMSLLIQAISTYPNDLRAPLIANIDLRRVVDDHTTWIDEISDNAFDVLVKEHIEDVFKDYLKEE